MRPLGDLSSGARGAHLPLPLQGNMTTGTSEAKDLMSLAERMGIPVDEAVRQLAQLTAEVEPPAAPPARTKKSARTKKPARREKVVTSVVA